MTIDIDRLTEAELIDLNRRVVKRLRLLDQMRAHDQMLEFKAGDRVHFQPTGRDVVEGMLTRYNRKTVTVITDNGGQWNVAPGFLSRAIRSSGDSTGLIAHAGRITPPSRANRSVYPGLRHATHLLGSLRAGGRGWVD